MDEYTQIQPRWPLTFDPTYGPYKSVDTPKESIVQNFRFLLRTLPGEWPGNPDLGIGIQQYLFENYNSPKMQQLETTIRNQLQKYLPEVVLLSMQVEASPDMVDQGKMIIKLRYAIPSIGEDGMYIEDPSKPVSETGLGDQNSNSPVGLLTDEEGNPVRVE